MDKKDIDDLIEKFNLSNDLTENLKIWVGHAKIGRDDNPSIEEAKEILKDFFDVMVPENTPTPERLKKVLSQWENYHPYQHVRELDQPMFIRREGETIIVAVIWPWQMKQGVASLMLYQGEPKWR